MRKVTKEWVVREKRHGLPEVWTADGEECITDRVFNGHGDFIASAPRMLDALKQALHHVRNIPADYDQVAVPKAFAIAAIAEGLKAAGIHNLAEVD